MFKKTEEMYQEENVQVAGSEIVNQASLFAKARAYSHNSANWFSDEDEDKDKEQKPELKQDSDDNKDKGDLPTFGSVGDKEITVEDDDDDDS